MRKIYLAAIVFCSVIAIFAASAPVADATTCVSGSPCTGGSGTWVAPAGVTSVTAQVWGGGGAGAGESANNDGGQSAGGGGAYSVSTNITVIPGNSYTIGIGAAGTASTGAGTAGGDTWFNAASFAACVSNTTCASAKGGTGGSQNTGNGTGGAAASGVGTTKFSGGDGGDGGALGTGSGGGGGSAGGTSNGGNGGNGGLLTGGAAGAAGSGGGALGGAGRANGGNGNPGVAPGGGGAGAYVNNNTNRSGGAGAAGQVILTYTADTTAPTVTSVSSSLANGSYTVGQVVPITVTFSETVNVTGTPQITLETGTTDRTVNYSSGSGSTVLTFNYTVQSGDTSSDLDYVSTSSLALNGGTIRDAALNNATLTLPTVGGANSIAGQKAIVIDTMAPTLAEVTPVTTPTSDTTPNYTFSTTEAGTITYGGDCSSGTSSATSGNNTVTFTALAAGVHSNCTVTVTDAAGNASSALAVSSFTIDTTAPTLTSRSIASNNTNTNQAKVGDTVTLSFTASETIGTPTVAFSSGGVAVAGSVTTANPSGNNWTASYTTQSGDTEGLVTFTVNFSDTAGNAGTQVTTVTDSSSVNFDKTAPLISQVTPVPSPTSDTTPNYTFSSFEAGTITYGGDCSSATTSATGGTQTITFNALSDGTHSNCTIRVTDAAGNQSNLLSVNTFIVDTAAPAAPGIPDMTAATDTGTSSTDDITSDTTPDFTVSCESGATVTLYDTTTSIGSGSCVSSTVTITSSALSAGTHASINAKQTDGAGNVSSASGNLSVTIDVTAPTLAEVTPVTTPTSDTTPNYTFSTTEAGTITYGGDCSSGTSSATSGNNTVTFTALAAGVHSNCTVTVTDAAGNASSALAVSSFTIDTTAPVLAEVTPVTTPTADTTPEYTFSSTEAGTISYGGDCSSATTSATSGNNTVTFNLLADGAHTNCTIIVTDAVGNASSALAISSFTIDATAPTLAEVTPVATPTNDATPSYTFSSTEAGTISYGGSCASLTTSATSGNNTVTFNSLADGMYSDCTVTVTDATGNVSNVLAISSFTIDTTAPVLAEVTPVTTPTNDATPNYTFSSDEAGTITYGGDCSSGTSSATSGNNTITFDTLSDGSHTNCTIRVTDATGNQSSLLSVSSFTVDATAPILAEVTPVTTPTSDTTPNYTFSSTEAGTISYGGDCSSATTSATSGNNTVTFDTLTDGTYSNCTITLTDMAGNASSALAVSSFTIDTTAPVLAEVTPVTTPTADTTPEYTFSSTEAGTISYGGSCSSATTLATSGNNTVTFTALASGTYTNCTIQVTDAVGNASNSITVSSFTIDTTVPILAEVTPVTTPTADSTPDYTFSSDETGTITYGGDCSSATTSATSGNNTITFNSLADGEHDNCTITVTDSLGNVSAALAVSAFTVDTTGPTLAEVTPVVTPANDTTPDYTFSSDEAGTITYGGSCTSSTTTATIGNNTITFDILPDGAYSDCTITVTDTLGNASTALPVAAFTIDSSGPVLAEVTPVATPTADNTPDYTFSSDEAGTITYGGDCSSGTSSATSGNNTVTFDVLIDGIHSNCTITVTDALGNVSAPLAVSAFTVDTAGPTVIEVTPVTTPTDDTTPEYTFSTTDPGTITYAGDCSSATTSATSGNNTITFNSLADGEHDNCTITVTDMSSNPSNILAVSTFVIDTTAPVLTEVTPVTTPTADNTPDYTFNSTEDGTITYGGSCGSPATSAAPGDNTITFDTLPDGTYSDCTITVTDALGHVSNSLAVSTFEINTTIAAKFVILDPMDVQSGNQTTVTVEARRADDTVDPNYQSDVTLVGTGTATGAGLVDIVNGIGTLPISDQYAEIVLLSLSDTQATGLDVTSTQDVEFLPMPGPATKFIIINPSDSYPNSAVTVSVRAVRPDHSVDTTYQSDVTLVASGASPVTGAGLVDIVNGVGQVSINSTSIQLVNLSLSDTQATGLDVTSTQDVNFARRTGGGGDGTLPPTLIQFSGRAYPEAILTIVTQDKDRQQNVPVRQDIIKSSEGLFSTTLTEVALPVQKTYGVVIADRDGRQTQTKFFTIAIKPNTTMEKQIFVAPTVGFENDIVAKGKEAVVVGFASPRSTVDVEVDGVRYKTGIVAERDGAYSVRIGTEKLAVGAHDVRVRQTDETGATSEFSLSQVFEITGLEHPEFDLNGDGELTITDWSRFLGLWTSSDETARRAIDFDGNRKVDLADFSAFIRALQQR